MSGIAFDPLISVTWIGVLAVALLVAAILAGVSRLRSAVLRVLAALAIIAALMNPQRVEEEREDLPDSLLVIRDRTDSTDVGDRASRLDALQESLASEVAADASLEAITITLAQSTEAGRDGSLLLPALTEGLGEIPASRFAGVVVLTDGQLHDIPETAQRILPEGIPLHVVVPEGEGERDRRMRVTVAPSYGLVDEESVFEFRVDDEVGAGDAVVELRINGELVTRESVPTNTELRFPVPIERRGRNTVELRAAPVEGEITERNNLHVSEISGIRDRLRVLLIVGAPNSGGRAWRNLLKSDPAVDLVQFTILTNPWVQDARAGQNELSLIQFPTQQLFEETLDEFDLVIFDQYKRRQLSSTGRSEPLIAPYQLSNIARWVEEGGALLVAAGAGYAASDSLARTPLSAVLPALPTGEVTETPFRARINDEGALHPITASFAGRDDDWGRWFRVVDTNVVSGNVLMEGPGAEPLLIVDKVGDGRVAVLASDQAWLWARGFDGGGPYSAVFRRLAHWLMGEPDLEAERLTARADGDTLLVERRSLQDDPGPVTITAPDGTQQQIVLTKEAEGIWRGTAASRGPGAYRLDGNGASDVAAVGALNPLEYSDLRATTEKLSPLVEANGGLITQSDSLPDIRRIRPGAVTAGDGWMGLVRHERYEVRASRRTDALPSWVYLLLAGLFIALAWRREST